MPRFLLALAAFLLVVLPAPAQKAADKPVLESWHAAYFEGLKAGHMHTLVKQVGTGEDARFVTTRTMQLLIKRYGSVLPVLFEQTCEETVAGKVLSLGMSYQLGKSPKTTLSGKVEGDNILIKIGNDDNARKVPFAKAALGLYAQEAIFHRKKVKAGDKVKLVSYELLLAAPLTIQALVKDVEATDRLVVKKDGGKATIVRQPAKLLRVETQAEPIMLMDKEVTLPGKITWLDGKLMPVREQMDMAGFTLTLYSTTKEAALKEGVAPDRLPDFGLTVSIPVKQTLDHPYQTTEATYRITLKEKVPGLFAKDERQTIRNEKDKSLELVVKAIRTPGTDDSATPPDKEYTESNIFIDWDNALIKKIATEVTAKETTAWKKAVALEKWVFNKMNPSTAVGFPSASQIAKDLVGDCRQHAVLLAALCRAVKIPSRTAVGVVYAREKGRSPHFMFHMWTEVWIKGRWVALDAVFGEGGIGAVHLKMAHHSWGKTATLAPLIPISQALGKIQIDIIETK